MSGNFRIKACSTNTEFESRATLASATKAAGALKVQSGRDFYVTETRVVYTTKKVGDR